MYKDSRILDRPTSTVGPDGGPGAAGDGATGAAPLPSAAAGLDGHEGRRGAVLLLRRLGVLGGDGGPVGEEAAGLGEEAIWPNFLNSVQLCNLPSHLV